MKIKTDIVLKNILTKESIKNDEKKPLTIGEFICNVLSMSASDNPHRSYVLAKKFGTQEEVTIDIDELKFLKDAISKSRVAPLSAGQAIDILEGNSEDEKINKSNKK